MSGSSLNTLLVQRVETALGVTLATHAQLASGARGRKVQPPGSAASLDSTESTTGKSKEFAHELRVRATSQANNAQEASGATSRASAGEQIKSSIVTTLSTQTAQAATPSTPAARSAQMHLSQIGKVLSPLLEDFPNGAPALTSKQPLFISAVLALRANLAERTLMQVVNNSRSDEEATEDGSQPSAREGKEARGDQVPRPASLPGGIGQAIAQATPLSSVLTSALMQVLRGQIVNSGLFYESHLLRQLQRTPGQVVAPKNEPQAQRTARAQGDEFEIETALRPLVRQQLDVLAGQPIQWQGQVWPNALMQWEIYQPGHLPADYRRSEQESASEGRTDHDASDESTPPWVTDITLDLPNLGHIGVRIAIRGDKVNISLKVDESGYVLAENLKGIYQTLEASDLKPESITLAAHESDDDRAT